MDYEFSSQLELFKRVKPALNSKCAEAHRLGFPDLRDIDIWNYLIENKWKTSKDLMLSDIVSDIMHCDFHSVELFLKDNSKNVIIQNTKGTEEII